MSGNFIRARSATQKSLRQAQILNAARAVIERQGLAAVTMTSLANEAGLAQSAPYRYFKSKEEILAHLLIAEADEITTDLHTNLSGCKDLSQVADCFAKVCAARPLFCALSSDLARTLEQNISVDRLVLIKREFGRVMGDWIKELLDTGAIEHQSVAIQFIRSAHIILAGLWPMTRDRPDVLEAAQRAGMYDTFGEFQSEFRTQLKLLVGGIKVT